MLTRSDPSPRTPCRLVTAERASRWRSGAARRAGVAAVIFTVSFGLSAWASLAHAFALQDETGQRADLGDRLGDGRWTLVMLWTIDCVPCEAQKPMIDAFHADHVDHDAHVIGIALDGPAALAEIERVKARTPVAFPTLIAYDDVFRDQYETLTGKPFRATPTYLLFRPDGELLGAHVGPIGRLALERVVEGG